jgi:hypothetical protein
VTIKLVGRKPVRSDLLQDGESVGEIRVDVTLTNAIDEGIARRGGLTETGIRRCQTNALIDTGAVMACVPADIVRQLGIAITGQSIATFADGRSETVGITEPIRFDILDRTTVKPALVLGDGVLIGQITLESTDLWADCRGQRLIPNPAHPDQPVFRV